MDVRPAREDDCTAIGEIARRSFETSYSLSPRQIDAIVREVFSEEALGASIDDPETLVLVAEVDGDGSDADGIDGFAVVELGDVGTLRWLHVHPESRGMDAGSALVARVRDVVEEEGRRFTARVLEEASEGSQFLERFGLHEGDAETFEFGEESFTERVYTADAPAADANEPAVDVPETVTADGRELPLDRDDRIPGSESPFYHVYLDRDFEERYGYFCSHCGSVDVSADGLDRLECENCGNEHRADEWDDAYL